MGFKIEQGKLEVQTKIPNIHNKNRKDFNESEIFYSIKE
jgi:hypothetical protein